MNWLRLHVSNLCNFKCPNCHVFELGENNLPNRVMSEDIFNQAIDQFLSAMKDLGHKSTMVSIYGGETLANKKVIKQGIARYGSKVNDIELKWVINTNGSLLNEEDVLFFKEHQVELHISVDGSEDIHNLSRPTHKGKGTFHMVTPALELIKKHSAMAQINSYMMPSNFEHLREIVDIANEYQIKKIYLDQFYNLDMISHQVGMQKYRDAYFYALSKDIYISGPWAKVMQRYHRSSPRIKEMLNRIAMDVNIDGTYYFPVNIESKKESRHIKDFQQLIHSGEYKKIIQKGVDNYQQSCGKCPLNEHCFGTAIEQVHYHIGEEAETEVSCNFFKDWISFLNRPVYFKKLEKIDVISVIPLEQAQSMLDDIESGIKELEEKFWPLQERIMLHLVEYPEELRGGSKQYNLPDWTRATTAGRNHLFHMGTELSRGYRHELTHFFLSQHSTEIPRWFTEGVCEWVRSPKWDTEFLQKSMLANNYLQYVLNSDEDKIVLIELDQAKLDQNHAYYQVKSFVLHLVKSHGEDKLLELLDNSSKSNFNSCFFNVLGVELKDEVQLFIQKYS